MDRTAGRSAGVARRTDSMAAGHYILERDGGQNEMAARTRWRPERDGGQNEMAVGISRTRPVTPGVSAESRDATRSATWVALPKRRRAIVSDRSGRGCSGTRA